MSRTALIAIELALLAGAAFIVCLIVGWPFGSSESSADPNRHAVLISDEGPRTPVPILAPSLTDDATPQTAAHQVKVPSVDCGPGVGGDVLATNQVVSYYGNPYTALMGVLGELTPDDLVAEVKARAQTYDSLNGDLGARPAIHMVYATAQSEPGREGKYLLYVDKKTLQEYIDLACRNNMLIFLDLQIGLSDVQTEVSRVLDYLAYPNVHLALDPEFAMQPGEVPGEAIGSLDAEDINTAQAMVQGLIEQNGLDDKIIVVHQFQDDMITRRELLQDYPNVSLVVDMDGYGPADVKRVKYGWYAEPSEHPGIKLFLKHDPDLMAESDVVNLGAQVVIYQ